MKTTDRNRKIVKVTLAGSIVNFLLLVFKFAAGVLGHSGAMIADAVHSLSDFVTDVIVLIFVKISSKPRDREHEYGHGKFETLATVVIGACLFFVGVSILVSSVQKAIDIWNGKDIAGPGFIALVAAALSILTKEVLFRVTRKVAREVGSPATEANAWHHRSDALSSIGTFLGIGAALILGDKWIILDPIAALVVSALIIKVAIEIILPGVNDLLEKSLPDDVQKEILDVITENPAVTDPHNLRTRRIGASIAAEVHIRVEPTMSVADSHELTKDIEQRMKAHFGNDIHIIIHVEPKK